MEINLNLNGRAVSASVRPDTLLLDFLRDQGCYSVKRGCETSNCGACTVLLDGRPVLSCSVLAARADGRTVQTLEGLQREAEAFVTYIADQGAEALLSIPLPCSGRIRTPRTRRYGHFWRATCAAVPAMRGNCGASGPIWTAEREGRRDGPAGA